MSCVSQGLMSGNTGKDEDRGADADRNLVISNIAKYVAKENRTSGHVKYALSFMLCSFLCLATVPFSAWILNRFFDGEFYGIGPRK